MGVSSASQVLPQWVRHVSRISGQHDEERHSAIHQRWPHDQKNAGESSRFASQGASEKELGHRGVTVNSILPTEGAGIFGQGVAATP